MNELKEYKKEETGLEIYNNKFVALSNALIQAREKASLLESKIELLAIYKMNDSLKSKEKYDVKGRGYEVHFVDISVSEIRNLTDKKGNSLYSYIEAAAYELKKKLCIYRNPSEHQFSMDNLYGEVSYDKGLLTIDFNPNTEHLFYELKSNFTKIPIDIAFQFRTNGGFQLYKLLKSYVYTLKPVDENLSQEEQETKAISFSLSELRLQLGYVDLNQPDIEKEGRKAFPDSEKMAMLDRNPKFKRWGDFYKNVLEVGMKEINNISDIFISEIEKKNGPHNKLVGVVFHVQNNKEFALKNKDNKGKNKNINKPIVKVPDIDEFIDQMQEIIKETLKIKELKSIAEAAEYDIEKIRKAYKIAEKSKKLDNLVGFLIKAVKDDYAEPVTKSKESDFLKMEETDYDFEQLESISRKK